MKVLVINGSPRAKGCTARALEEVMKVLRDEGVETELMQLGAQDIRGCLACGGCRGTHRCVIDDAVNKAADKLRECDEQAGVLRLPQRDAALLPRPALPQRRRRDVHEGRRGRRQLPPRRSGLLL